MFKWELTRKGPIFFSGECVCLCVCVCVCGGGCGGGGWGRVGANLLPSIIHIIHATD